MPSVISKKYIPEGFEAESFPEDFKPTSVVLETTYSCNMRCLHCGTSCGEKKDGELTLDEHLNLSKELHSLGLKEIFLSGGEALMNKDWPIIAKAYGDLGVRVVLLSNGLLIPKNFKEIKKSPISQIAISIDGTRETHEKIRKVKGSYQNALDSIQLINKNSDITPSVITTVSKWNIDELEELEKELIENGNILWQLQRVFPTGRMDKDFILDFKDVERLHKFIHDRRVDKSYKMQITGACDATPFSKYNTRDIGENYFGCPAGVVCLGIEADGNVKGCLTQPSEFVEGNIKTSCLTDIWRDLNNFAYNRFFDEDEVKKGCKGCDHLDICRCGCTVQAYSEAGDRYDQIYCLHSNYYLEYKKKLSKNV